MCLPASRAACWSVSVKVTKTIFQKSNDSVDGNREKFLNSFIPLLNYISIMNAFYISSSLITTNYKQVLSIFGRLYMRSSCMGVRIRFPIFCTHGKLICFSFVWMLILKTLNIHQELQNVIKMQTFSYLKSCSSVDILLMPINLLFLNQKLDNLNLSAFCCCM